jgi:hypothetical protein
MGPFKGAMVVIGAGWMLAACGGSGSDAPTKWEGSTPHLNVVGTIMGEQLNIDITGALAADTNNLWCEREYQVPTDASGNPIYAMGHNSEVRIKAPVTISGQARIFDIELKEHDFQADPPSTIVTVVPRDDSNPPCAATGCTQPTHMWLQLVWDKASDGSQIYKQAALNGQYTSGEFTGMPDATGLLYQQNNGKVGGFATGQWSPTESLTISFDANCTTNDIDNG